MTVNQVRDAIQPWLTDFDLLLVGTVGPSLRSAAGLHIPFRT